MQSEECCDRARVSPGAAHRYGIFRLATLVSEADWRNGLSLAFPPGDVAALAVDAVTPACVGLLGMAGALPYHYTESVTRGGEAARSFLDLLSARAIDAFCCAWREGRPEFTPLPAIPIQRGPLRARALGERMAQALGVPLVVEQFCTSWQELPPEQCSALGAANAGCGAGALLGARLRRIDSAVRIRVGPLTGPASQAFLPGGAAALALASMWCAAAGSLQAEARIEVWAESLTGALLDGAGRLGYDTLLAPGRLAGTRDDLRYRLC